MYRITYVYRGLQGLLQVEGLKTSPSILPYYKLYRIWLQHKNPDWTSFKLASHAEYLVFEIGPAAGSCQWHKLISSVQTQLTSLDTCAPPPSLRILSIITLGFALSFPIKPN